MLPAIAMAAGLGLGAAGMFRKQKNFGYSKGDLDYIASLRQREINDFANELAAARQRYLAQLPQFQQNAMNRFVPNLESQFAGRGLSVTGGAFQSELAKKAADFQSEQMLSSMNMERDDLARIDAARGQMRASQLGNQPSNPASDPAAGAMGMLSSALLSYGASAYQPKAPVASVQGSGKTSLWQPLQTQRSVVAPRFSGMKDIYSGRF